jgi:hypothetical protein
MSSRASDVGDGKVVACWYITANEVSSHPLLENSTNFVGSLKVGDGIGLECYREGSLGDVLCI